MAYTRAEESEHASELVAATMATAASEHAAAHAEALLGTFLPTTPPTRTHAVASPALSSSDEEGTIASLMQLRSEQHGESDHLLSEQAHQHAVRTATLRDQLRMKQISTEHRRAEHEALLGAHRHEILEEAQSLRAAIATHEAEIMSKRDDAARLAAEDV
jgi:hypothetical protein